MKKYKDILLLIAVLIFMVGCSKAVPDSRYMEVERQLKSDIVKTIQKQVDKHIEDAHYLVSAPLADEEPLLVEEVPAEEVIEQNIVNPTIFDNEESATTEEVETPGLVYIGDYRVTAYEWTGNPCANGNYPSEGYTVACNDLPFGTEVYIDGVGWRVVEDRGGGGEGWMDLYLGDVSACYEWGVQYRSVYVYE